MSDSKIDKQDIVKLLVDARKSPSVTNLRWEGKSKSSNKFYMVAALPKSGSTWVTNVISKSLGCRIARYCYAWSSNEHEIYVPSLLSNYHQRSVAQMHIRATPHNIALCVDFNINVLILTRNVFDNVVSFARDLQTKCNHTTKLPGVLGYSFVWLPNCDVSWDLHEFVDYSIKFYLPWYLNFLCSWSSYRQTISGRFLRYEDLQRNPNKFFIELLNSWDEKATLYDKYEKNMISSRLISGSNSKPGSGYNFLNKKQKNDIMNMFSYTTDPWVLSHLNFDVK